MCVWEALGPGWIVSWFYRLPLRVWIDETVVMSNDWRGLLDVFFSIKKNIPPDSVVHFLELEGMSRLYCISLFRQHE